MSEHPLYPEITGQLKQYLGEKVSESSLERLSMVVLGIMSGKRASPSNIAKAVQQLGLSQASQESIERRVRRYENDGQISSTLCFHPLARAHLQLSQQQHLTLVLDPTTQEERVVMLCAGVWYRGRCLPLAWMCWAGNQPLKGAGFWQRVAQLLEEIATLIPAKMQVTWLADRAFGTPMFTDLVVQRGWHFIVRVQGQTHYRDSQGREGSIRQLVAWRGQRRKLSGQAFKKASWRKVSIVVFWGCKHTQPLCLVTDLPPCYTHVQHYRRRYGIEGCFRDFKTYGWHWEQAQVTDFAHLERLLVAMALAAWFTVMAGASVALELLAKAPSGERLSRPFDAKHSLFALGLQRLDCWLHRNPIGTLFWSLPAWDAPAWSFHCTAHHVHPTLFN